MNINAKLREMSVGSRYGAPMGRSQVADNPQAHVHLQMVVFQDGDYDLGGAYWGSGGNPLWCAMDEEGEFQWFRRAESREKALEYLKFDFPDMTVLDDYEIDLDEFVRHYVMAMLWSSTDDDGNPLDDNYDFNDLSSETLEKVKADCESFIRENKSDLLTWKSDRYSIEEMGGHDFWLTRCHHGSGYWDGDWDDEVGRRLTDAAHAFGEQYPCAHSGKIYID